MISRQAIDQAVLDTAREQGHLFAILDACDAPAVPVLCAGLGESHAVSLYRGSAEEQFADIAPYLVHVDSDALLEWVLQFSVTPGWGIMVIAPVTLDVLRTHFRKFLKVHGPEGRPLYFRFYDPRTLDVFLPTCTAQQLLQFYGPVERFALAETAEMLTVLDRTDRPIPSVHR